jgi:hypothetical protein
MAPALHPENKGLPFYSLVHERYRNPLSFPYDRHYETNGWFFLEDPLGNAMKNRLVMNMNILGLNVSGERGKGLWEGSMRCMSCTNQYSYT